MRKTVQESWLGFLRCRSGCIRVQLEKLLLFKGKLLSEAAEEKRCKRVTLPPCDADGIASYCSTSKLLLIKGKNRKRCKTAASQSCDASDTASNGMGLLQGGGMAVLRCRKQCTEKQHSKRCGRSKSLLLATAGSGSYACTKGRS